MKCPFCGELDTQVKDSRASEDNLHIKRRRHCNKCGSRFTTIERIQLREIYVLKKSGEKKLFDRDKILRAIKTAVRKRDISDDQIEILVNNIVQKFEKMGLAEISTSLIGDEIMNELSKLDQVAYVRFASVYKDFNTAQDFEKFIENLSSKPK